MAHYWNRFFPAPKACLVATAFPPAAACLVAMACLLTTACHRSDTGQVDGIIAQVKEQYAPDKRTVLFSVSAEKSGPRALISGETSSPEAKRALFALLDSAGFEMVDSVQLLPGTGVGTKVF